MQGGRNVTETEDPYTTPTPNAINTGAGYLTSATTDEAPYAGPVGMSLLTLAYKLHTRIALNSDPGKVSKFDLSKRPGPYIAPHGCNFTTALVDKYANY